MPSPMVRIRAYEAPWLTSWPSRLAYVLDCQPVSSSRHLIPMVNCLVQRSLPRPATSTWRCPPFWHWSHRPRRNTKIFAWHPSEASSLFVAAAAGRRGLVEVRDAGADSPSYVVRLALTPSPHCPHC